MPITSYSNPDYFWKQVQGIIQKFISMASTLACFSNIDVVLKHSCIDTSEAETSTAPETLLWTDCDIALWIMHQSVFSLNSKGNTDDSILSQQWLSSEEQYEVSLL